MLIERCGFGNRLPEWLDKYFGVSRFSFHLNSHRGTQDVFVPIVEYIDSVVCALYKLRNNAEALREHGSLYENLQCQFAEYSEKPGEMFPLFISELSRSGVVEAVSPCKVECFEDFLNELTRKQIIQKNDPQFLNQVERVKQLKSTRLVDMVRDTVVFRTRSADFTRSRREYTERIRLLRLDKLLKKYAAGDMKLSEVFRLAVSKGDIELYCTCPAFLYWGFQYINTQTGSVLKGKGENRFPGVRNDQLSGMYCKHLSVALEVLPLNTMRILKLWKNKNG